VLVFFQRAAVEGQADPEDRSNNDRPGSPTLITESPVCGDGSDSDDGDEDEGEDQSNSLDPDNEESEDTIVVATEDA